MVVRDGDVPGLTDAGWWGCMGWRDSFAKSQKIAARGEIHMAIRVKLPVMGKMVCDRVLRVL